MPQLSISTLSRRYFLSYLALGTFGLMAKDLLYPASAMADSKEAGKYISIVEKYHIFVPYTTAKKGGKETFTLRSGETCSVEIIPQTEENQEIIIKGRGQKGKDITVVFHTLYDQELRLADQIYQEIDKNTQFLEESSKKKCKFVYENVEEANYIKDLIALDFLDYVIYSSKLDNKIQQRYQLASTNSRLLEIKQAIESTLAESELTETEKKLIVGTYAYVRAEEPVPDFKALTDLDSIVASSSLPLEIKRIYSIASAKSRALTVDLILIKEINDTKKLTFEQKVNYLSIYQAVRDGKKTTDEATLNSLDSFIHNADIPDNAKVVYLLARSQNLDNLENFTQTVDAFVEDADEFRHKLERAKNQGAAIVPQATKVLTTIGAETATGVSIGSLSGAAATNATLAVLGGGSVAAGGLGMLGGLAVATGGAALIGAAGMLSIALVSEMDSEDQKNLGIAIGTGTIAGATTVLAAWTAASALGVTGTLSGAAAITTTISALGGLSAITGGAALVASGTAFLIWSFLKGQKKRDQAVLRQLETRTYTLTEDPLPGSLGEFLQKNVQKYNFEEGFSAPNMPLDKLSNALSTWLSVNREEKVIALIDNSIWHDAKEGIVFTERRLIWKNKSIEYEDLARFVKTETALVSLLSQEKQKQELSKLKKVVDILSDKKYATDLSKLKGLVAIVSDDQNLAELVSQEKSRNNVPRLQKIADVLLDERDNRNLSKVKDVTDILSDKHEDDLVRFLTPQLASQLSDKQYMDDLSNLKDVVDRLSDEFDKYNLTTLLREIGQKYSTV
ncbi:hypothetical protein [Coleofasciculus sp. FACHB-SPT9]|uniref:hypothetical protein n=1 Tax=Cyanophyceae TaxID=3028117 RepID=UPI0018F049C2|nr:hypothetical protein [Coleofasciculus sp. FACHB-SPT9]